MGSDIELERLSRMELQQLVPTTMEIIDTREKDVSIKRNHFEVIMSVCFSHDIKHVHFEVISFYNSKDI